MQEFTIDRVLEEENITLTYLAYKVGCSVSLLSKIKNGNEVITDNIQEKFNKVYPEYHLVGGKQKWKEKYLDELSYTRKLEAKIEKLNNYIDKLESRLAEIRKIAGK